MASTRFCSYNEPGEGGGCHRDCGWGACKNLDEKIVAKFPRCDKCWKAAGEWPKYMGLGINHDSFCYCSVSAISKRGARVP